MRLSPPKRNLAVIFVVAILLAGCRSGSDYSAPKSTFNAATPDLDAEIARASSLHQCLLILVAESGQSHADDAACTLFLTLIKEKPVVPVLLDLSVSRNRPTAARFHITTTPLLVSLSSKGIIITRDEQPITKKLILHRLDEIAWRGHELDAKVSLLEDAVARNPNDSTTQLNLAEFLLAQQNAREAIPILESVAHSASVDTASRVRAWVEIARAHFWIAESEKGRHEAGDLIARLGPKTNDAVAGGNLILGLQDANAKRSALASREFQAAIVAAPESDYAKEAKAALAKIPGKNK